MNRTKIQHISGLESMEEQVLLETLKGLEPHQIANVNWQEYPYSPEVTFRMAYSDKVLAILFEVTEDHVRAQAMNNNGPVWEDSCVEFFVKNQSGTHYTNFEMNCVGTMLAASRTSRHDAVHFDDGKMAQIRRITSLPHKIIDSRGTGQSWWGIEVIPFEIMGFEQKPQKLEANLYKCGDKCDQPHFLSWSPIGLPSPNFHCPEFFGTIEL